MVKRCFWLFVVGFLVFFVDFFTKAWAISHLPLIDLSTPYYPYGGVGVFHNFLGVECALNLTLNRGAAWGMLSHFQGFLLVMRLVVVIALIAYFFFTRNPRTNFPLLLIIGGAIGNVADFFLYGYVVDFLHFNFWGYDFPIFNVADAAITLGVALLLVNAWYYKRKRYDIPL